MVIFPRKSLGQFPPDFLWSNIPGTCWPSADKSEPWARRRTTSTSSSGTDPPAPAPRRSAARCTRRPLHRTRRPAHTDGSSVCCGRPRRPKVADESLDSAGDRSGLRVDRGLPGSFATDGVTGAAIASRSRIRPGKVARNHRARSGHGESHTHRRRPRREPGRSGGRRRRRRQGYGEALQPARAVGRGMFRGLICQAAAPDERRGPVRNQRGLHTRWHLRVPGRCTLCGSRNMLPSPKAATHAYLRRVCCRDRNGLRLRWDERPYRVLLTQRLLRETSPSRGRLPRAVPPAEAEPLRGELPRRPDLHLDLRTPAQAAAVNAPSRS